MTHRGKEPAVHKRHGKRSENAFATPGASGCQPDYFAPFFSFLPAFFCCRVFAGFFLVSFLGSVPLLTFCSTLGV